MDKVQGLSEAVIALDHKLESKMLVDKYGTMFPQKTQVLHMTPKKVGSKMVSEQSNKLVAAGTPALEQKGKHPWAHQEIHPTWSSKLKKFSKKKNEGIRIYLL